MNEQLLERPPSEPGMCRYCGPSSLTPRWNLIRILLTLTFVWLLGFQTWLWAMAPPGEQTNLVDVGEGAKEGRGALQDFYDFFKEEPILGLAILVAIVLMVSGWNMRRRRGR